MLSLELNTFLHGGSADATESLLILTRVDHRKRLIMFGEWNSRQEDSKICLTLVSQSQI